jgi:hypothetical protein
MQKTIYYILLLYFLSLSVFAQEGIEIQGGINIANLSDPGNLTPDVKWKSRTGFSFSVSTTIPFSKKIFLNSGLRYIQKGTNAELSPYTTNILTNTYLELPIYLKYSLSNMSTKFFIIGGPTISYLLASQISQDSGGGSFDTKEDYKSYNVSLDIGISTQNRLNQNTLLITTILYSHGLVKINALGSKEQTRDIIMMIGIYVHLNKNSG